MPPTLDVNELQSIAIFGKRIVDDSASLVAMGLLAEADAATIAPILHNLYNAIKVIPGVDIFDWPNE